MSEGSGRAWAVREVMGRAIRVVPELAGGMKVLDLFGSNTFDIGAMKQKLPKSSFQSLLETVRSGSKLDAAIRGK